jgi:hypothetical protein
LASTKEKRLARPSFEKLRVRDRARTGLDVGLEAVKDGVDLADGGVAQNVE